MKEQERRRHRETENTHVLHPDISYYHSYVSITCSLRAALSAVMRTPLQDYSSVLPLYTAPRAHCYFVSFCLLVQSLCPSSSVSPHEPLPLLPQSLPLFWLEN